MIWIVVPAMVATLIFLILIVGLIYAVIWLLSSLPPLFRRVQDFMVRLHYAVRRGADASAAPFIKVSGFGAAWRALRRRFGQ